MNIPPKSLKQQLARNGIEPLQRAPRPEPERPPLTAGAPSVRERSAVADIEDVSTESLPVLQAFQDFLETERKHARRQILAITSFFLMLFAIVTAAGVFFGYVYLGKLNGEIAFLHNELNLTRSSLAQEADNMLEGLTKRTEALTTRVANGDSLIRQATSDISNTVSNSLSERSAEIDDIRAALTELRNENRSFRQNLARMRPLTPAAAPAVASKPAEPAKPLAAPVASVNIETQIVDRLPTPPTSNAFGPVEIAILAPGSSETMKWRIPISE